MPPVRRLAGDSWDIIRSNPKAPIVRAIVRRDLHRVLKKEVQESKSDAELIVLIQDWEAMPPPVAPAPPPPPPGAIGNLAIDMNAPPIEMGFIEAGIKGIRTVREVGYATAKWKMKLSDLSLDDEELREEVSSTVDQADYNITDYEDYDNQSDPDVTMNDDPEDIELSPWYEMAGRIVHASAMSVARQMVLDILSPQRYRGTQHVRANDPHLQDPGWLQNIWSQTRSAIQHARDIVEGQDGELPEDLFDLNLLPGQTPAIIVEDSAYRCVIAEAPPIPPPPPEDEGPVNFIDFSGEGDGDDDDDEAGDSDSDRDMQDDR